MRKRHNDEIDRLTKEVMALVEVEDMKPNASQWLKAHNKLGQSFTPMEALKYFGCLRLASRISDIRRKGYAIDRTMVEDKKTGKRYASYSLSTINNN